MGISKFNLRVYALIIDTDHNVLITEESYKGQRLNKFPGGGVQFGEGLKDALFRELNEELGLEPSSYELYYVNDDMIQSAFAESEQLISFYYKVSLGDEKTDNLESKDPNVLSLSWRQIEQLELSELTFPIDRRICSMLQEEL